MNTDTIGLEQLDLNENFWTSWYLSNA